MPDVRSNRERMKLILAVMILAFVFLNAVSIWFFDARVASCLFRNDAVCERTDQIILLSRVFLTILGGVCLALCVTIRKGMIGTLALATFIMGFLIYQSVRQCLDQIVQHEDMLGRCLLEQVESSPWNSFLLFALVLVLLKEGVRNAGAKRGQIAESER